LVLAAPVPVGGLADVVGIRLEEQHLGHALVGIDARRQRRGVAELQGHVPLPLGFQRGHVDDDPAARVGALAQADHQGVARDPEVLHRARQREGVGRDDAHVRLDVDEALRVEVLGIDDGRVDVGEHLELARAAHVVAVARGAVADDALAPGLLDLSRLEGLDHALRALGHAADPAVGLDAHGAPVGRRPGARTRGAGPAIVGKAAAGASAGYSSEAEMAAGARGSLPSSATMFGATSRLAAAAAESGSATTTGGPASPCSRMARSSGSEPSRCTPYWAAMRAPPPSPKTCWAWPQWLHTWTAMFSTRPRTATSTFSNMRRPLRASRVAMSCGVVTMTAPATGIFWARVSWMSPVPGGRSTTR